MTLKTLTDNLFNEVLQWCCIENVHHHFVISIGYCITEACITNSLLLYESIQNNRDFFYDDMVLIFFMNTLQSFM